MKKGQRKTNKNERKSHQMCLIHHIEAVHVGTCVPTVCGEQTPGHYSPKQSKNNEHKNDNKMCKMAETKMVSSLVQVPIHKPSMQFCYFFFCLILAFYTVQLQD